MDWNYWLGRKYDNLGVEAAARQTAANASMIDANANANLTNVRAGLLPAESAANVAETEARTRQTNTTADLAPGLAKASEASSYASAFANRAQGGLYGSQTTAEDQANELIKNNPGLANSTLFQALVARLTPGLVSTAQ